MTFEVFSSFGSKLWLYALSSSLPTRSSLRSHSSSLSFSPSLPSTLVDFKYSNKGPIALSFTSSSASLSSHLGLAS